MELNNKLNNVDLSIFSHIKVFHNVFTPNCADTFIDVCKNKFNDFNQAAIVNKHFENEVNKKVRDVANLKLCRQNDDWTKTIWYKYFKNVFLFKAQDYCNLMSNNKYDNIVSCCEEINVLKYEQTGHYSFHIDHGRTTPRTLSAIYFVNDDFKGGELIFSDPSYEIEITIPPEKNSLVIWPSNFLYPHKVNAVTEGVRYTVVSWLT